MEKVDYLLEQMLPELHDLQEKKLFTQDEIREIIKRRTAFERALVRRVARKEDFIRYAEYELNVEALRKKRLGKKKTEHSKPSISSYSIVKRALYIFERATKKFKGDVSLWIQYAEVAKKQHARKLVSKVLAQALTQHPLSPTLYILLSSHELTENLSPSAARTLLQRGLRLLPHSVPLWTEYAKMELIWVERLRRRWDILGVKDPELEAESEGAEGRKAIMDGAVVRAVWEGARKALPGSMELHASFLRLFRTFPTVLRPALLEQTVYASLREDMAGSAEAWTQLAMRRLEDVPFPEPEGGRAQLEGKALVDALKIMVDEFKAGVKALKGKEKNLLLLAFAQVLKTWEAKVDEDGLKRYLSHHSAQLLSLPNTTAAVQCLHLDHLLSVASSPPSKVLAAARSSTKLFPGHPSVWARRARAELRHNEDAVSLDAALRSATEVGLSVVPSEDNEDDSFEREGWEDLWEVTFEYLSDQPREIQTSEIHRLLERSLRTPPSSSLNASPTGSSLPLHTHLLIACLPLLHPYSAPPPPATRLQTYASFKTLFLPTPAFYSFAFMHESLLPAARPVLERVHADWRGAGGEDDVECHVAWMRWLMGEGDSKGVRDCLKRLGRTGLGERVEERWREILAEQEEEDQRAQSEDDDAMVE